MPRFVARARALRSGLTTNNNNANSGPVAILISSTQQAPDSPLTPHSFSRKIKQPRLSGRTMFLLTGAMMGVGFFAMARGNQERRAEKAEQRAVRASMVAYLQAEEDRRWVKRQAAMDAKERELFKHDSTWVVGGKLYNTPGFFTPPADFSMHPSRMNRS